MIKGGFGGGRTITGLTFEKKANLLRTIAELPQYEVSAEGVISFSGEAIAQSLRKDALYRYLKKQGINYKEYLSKKLLPDDAILNLKTKTLYIIEMKFQSVAGSVDEKLQTCDFKKKQYIKLLSTLGIRVEYIYILNDWFEHHSYADVKEYILSVGCKYYIETLPLVELSLPLPEKDKK